MLSVQAIDFVQMQQDDELWDLLIALALSQAPLTGETGKSSSLYTVAVDLAIS